MSHSNQESCGCASHSSSISQSLSEIEFERGIWQAVLDEDLNKIQKMIAKDPNTVNMQDNSGYTGLHYACRRSSNIDILRYLLDHGANPDAKTKAGGATPLHRACHFGLDECVKILLDYKANPMLIDADGKTALHKAAQNGKLSCFQLLLNRKPELKDIKDKNLKTASNYLDN